MAVNAHWQADAVAAHLAQRPAPPRTVLLRETTLLETGGGVRAALPILGTDPFFVVNGDAFWLNGPISALRPAGERRSTIVDGVLLVHRTSHVHAEVGLGDFALDKWGTPRRRKEREVVPYIYAGVQLIHPRLLDEMPEGAFSMNRAWDARWRPAGCGPWCMTASGSICPPRPTWLKPSRSWRPAFTGDARWPWR